MPSPSIERSKGSLATRYLALALGFVLPFLAVGIPYWRIPYSQASLPDTLYTWALGVVLAAAALLRARLGRTFGSACLTAGLGPPAAVLARVVVETAIDPTSHNLWPFEIVIAATVGLVVAAAGALLGSLARRLLGERAA